MSELADFLLARIAEDEEWAPESGWIDGDGRCNYCGGVGAARVLAECAAKRRIVAMAGEGDMLEVSVEQEFATRPRDPDELYFGERLLCALALPYADHPDYRPEWRL